MRTRFRPASCTAGTVPPAIFTTPLPAVRVASVSGLIGLCALALLLDTLEDPSR